MTDKIVTSAFLVIGDEILSGRTVDQNINFLAKSLGEIGVNLKEVRVVPDDESEIVEAVNALRKKYDYIFTSGGLGPTHDDITSESIAKAFDDDLIKDKEAEELLLKYYGEDGINKARMKMAFLPSKAKLIPNDLFSVSGYRVENVFVFAGIPKIFKSLFEGSKKEIIGGKKTKTKEITTHLTEGLLAADFANLQKEFLQVVMGSYPSENGTSLVFRSTDYEALEIASSRMVDILKRIKP